MSAKRFHVFLHKQQWIIQENKRKQTEKQSGFKLPSKSFMEYLKSYPLTGNENNFFQKYIDRAELIIASSIVGKRNEDDYYWICENFPDECPKSYGGYMRMKNQNTKNFRKLADLCLQKGRNIEIEDKYTEQSKKLRELISAEEAAYKADYGIR